MNYSEIIKYKLADLGHKVTYYNGGVVEGGKPDKNLKSGVLQDIIIDNNSSSPVYRGEVIERSKDYHTAAKLPPQRIK